MLFVVIHVSRQRFNRGKKKKINQYAQKLKWLSSIMYNLPLIFLDLGLRAKFNGKRDACHYTYQNNHWHVLNYFECVHRIVSGQTEVIY